MLRSSRRRRQQQTLWEQHRSGSAEIRTERGKTTPPPPSPCRCNTDIKRLSIKKKKAFIAGIKGRLREQTATVLLCINTGKLQSVDTTLDRLVFIRLLPPFVNFFAMSLPPQKAAPKSAAAVSGPGAGPSPAGQLRASLTSVSLPPGAPAAPPPAAPPHQYPFNTDDFAPKPVWSTGIEDALGWGKIRTHVGWRWMR